MSRAQTMKLQGNDYAKVAERIKLFREDCPNGSIETSYDKVDGEFIFTAVVVKDLNDPASARATAHSTGAQKKTKDFEKLETIAVGRALANLGYLSTGEVASSEEMEEFIAYKDDQRADSIDNAITQIKATKNLDELKKVWESFDDERTFTEVVAAKDDQKMELVA